MDINTALERETPAGNSWRAVRDAYEEVASRAQEGQGVCGSIAGPGNISYLLHSVGYRPPEILVFWCENDGYPARVVQHYRYCNVVFQIVDLDDLTAPLPTIGFAPPATEE